ncbi:hypothetical protein ACFQ3N_06800 [Virgibacillus byunsanensis]|uniref:Pilus assembly protein PilO n=1 Tax=Virgibacillus byunsanensis TaxID=570945 RepID=A0ABW3LJ33_9BACI
MNKQWTKKYTFITVAIVVAALLIYGITYFSIIKPIQKEARTLEQEAKMYETQYERITNEDDRSLNEESPDAIMKIPNLSSPDNVLNNLESFASSTNTTITYIESITTDRSEELEKDGVASQEYAMDITGGNLADIDNFLEAMLESERLLFIDTIYISKLDESHDLSLTFRAFSTK